PGRGAAVAPGGGRGPRRRRAAAVTFNWDVFQVYMLKFVGSPVSRQSPADRWPPGFLLVRAPPGRLSPCGSLTASNLEHVLRSDNRVRSAQVMMLPWFAETCFTLLHERAGGTRRRLD